MNYKAIRLHVIFWDFPVSFFNLKTFLFLLIILTSYSVHYSSYYLKKKKN